ncbi:MAG: LuxR C-terminal-related transcriptional regulator [Pseudomonadales bacterium]
MPEDFLHTQDWYDVLADLAGAVSGDDFPRKLAQAYQGVTTYNSSLIVAYTGNHSPLYLFDNLPEEEKQRTLKPYFDGAYLLDPFYDLYRNGAEDGIYQLSEIAPDEFYQSEYYQTYYSATHLRDEATILVAVNDKLHLLISLGQRGSGSQLSDAEFARLKRITPLMIALCRKHWSDVGLPGVGDGAQILGGPLDKAFRNFGRSYLSDRECEVIHLILKGHSSKSIARLLGISPDTVKVHRKRFHSKLEITSAAELFSLFLEAISLVPLDSEEDPLTYYYAQTTSH